MIMSATNTCQNLSDQSQLNRLFAIHITIFASIASTANTNPKTIAITTITAKQPTFESELYFIFFYLSLPKL